MSPINWDWNIKSLTLNGKIVIRHNSRKIKSCTIQIETPEGLVKEEHPNLTIKSNDNGTEIIWIKYFPQYGTKYRIEWEYE